MLKDIEKELVKSHYLMDYSVVLDKRTQNIPEPARHFAGLEPLPAKGTEDKDLVPSTSSSAAGPTATTAAGDSSTGASSSSTSTTAPAMTELVEALMKFMLSHSASR